jgi:hypothetical protein
VGDKVWRTDDPIVQIRLPSSAPTLTLTGATPRATVKSLHFDPYLGKSVTFRAGATALTGDARPNNLYHAGLYHDSTSGLTYSIHYVTYNTDGTDDWGLVAMDLGTPSMEGGSDVTDVAYGPWRIANTDDLGTVWKGPERWGFMSKHPITGLPIGGGLQRSGTPNTAWGPTLYGGEAWPDSGTSGGFAAADITANRRYLEYYYPVIGGPMAVAESKYINVDGSINGALTSFQMNKAGYTHIWEPDFFPPRASVNPALNGGVPSWNSSDAVTGVLWTNGPDKQCVIFSGTLQIADEESSASEDASHVFYRNEHQYTITASAGFTPGAGGACQNGETYTGLTSGSVMGGPTTYTAGLNAVQGPDLGTFQTWQVGETIEGGTSGCTGVVTTAHRHNACSHGFERTVTGDFSTNATASLILMDPARLESNKTGGTVDYETQADYIIDAEALGAKVAQYNSNPSLSHTSGTFKSITGFFCNPATRYFYTIGLSADMVGSNFETVIHVWQLSVGANCVGY